MVFSRPKAFPAGIAKILDSVISARNLKKRIEDCHVFEVWDDVVGDKIAVRTEPVTFRKGVLKVTVTDHGWLQQLQFLKEEIRERLNKAAGRDVVESLYFQIGSVSKEAKPGPHIPDELKKIKLSKDETSRIDEALAGVDSSEIKEAMRKVMIKEAKRKKLT